MLVVHMVLLTPPAISPALNVAVVTGRAIVESTVSIDICEIDTGLQVPLAGLVLARASILKDKIAAVNSDGELTTWGDANKVVQSVTCTDYGQLICTQTYRSHMGAYHSYLPIVRHVRYTHPGL